MLCTIHFKFLIIYAWHVILDIFLLVVPSGHQESLTIFRASFGIGREFGSCQRNLSKVRAVFKVMRDDCYHWVQQIADCIVMCVTVCAGDIATDDRSYEMHLVNAMDIAATNVYFYPRLIPIVSIHFTLVYTGSLYLSVTPKFTPNLKSN